MGTLDIHRLNHYLFEQQTLAFKGLIKFCWSNSISNSSTEKAISKILGLYLISFSDYYDMANTQKIYLKRIISTIIDIYIKYPNMMKYWYEIIQEENDVTSFVREKNKSIFQLAINDYKFIPIYDLIRSFIFIEEDHSQLGNFIKLYLIEDSSLKNWLETKSDTNELFIDKFLKYYNNSVLDNPEDHKFKDYLKAYYAILNKCNNSRLEHLDNFKTKFLEEILLVNANITTCLYVNWLLIHLLPYKEEEFLTSVIQGPLFIPFLYQLKEMGKKEETKVLDLITSLISISDFFISIFFDIEEAQYTNEYLNEVRIRAMLILKHLNVNIEDQLLRRFFEYDLPNRTLLLNNIMVDFILLNLITTFQNSMEFNGSLFKLLEILFLKVNLFSNKKICLILEFLYEVYLIYTKIFENMELDKYCTLQSSDESEHYYMLPSAEMIEILELEMNINKSKITNWNELLSNVRLFEKLIILIYVDFRIKEMHNSRNTD